MWQRCCSIRSSSNCNKSPQFILDGFFQFEFNTVQFHWWQEFSIRKIWKIFYLSAYADEGFDVVIPRGHFIVTNWPINRDTVFRVGFKIKLAKAITLTSPHE